jgi:hypothetical protein
VVVVLDYFVVFVLEGSEEVEDDVHKEDEVDDDVDVVVDHTVLDEGDFNGVDDDAVED